MFKNVLLTVDLNDESSWTKALPVALDFIKASDGTLHVMTVVPNFGMSIVGSFFPKGYEKDICDKVLVALKEFVKTHISDDIKTQRIVSEGTVYEEILNMADKIKADMIVVSSGRDDLKDFLLGPNAARVVRHANCSVTVVR
ncbi:MAG: universal stress protein UspA [Rhodospirillaceae bacterium]|nr:MAG: universal stress protein UspA [Rhodospirillaceae bacterium]